MDEAVSAWRTGAQAPLCPHVNGQGKQSGAYQDSGGDRSRHRLEDGRKLWASATSDEHFR